MAGIDFAAGQAAASVVLAGVYPDDDQGDVVIYTGQGGLLPGTSKAVADQKPVLGNAGLIRSRNFGVPVRVIRKIGRNFRYDGTFVVDNYFRDRHASDGFIRWRYELRKLPASATLVLRDEATRPERVAQTIQHVLFDFGGITVLPETLTVTGDRATEGQPLYMVRRHRLDLLNFDYHREAIFVPVVDRPDR